MCDKKNCCVVVVTHKETLCGDDEISLLRCLEVFKNRDIKLVIPDNISTEYYEKLKQKYKFDYVKLSPDNFSSWQTYNAMCLSSWFYSLFNDYEYILIYHTDSWVFEDNLDYFMSLDYDYYGAPWPFINDGDCVGNGGFSLRKVSKMIELTKKYDDDDKNQTDAEDLWFCYCHGDELKKCDLETACNFAIEHICDRYKEIIKTHPMGMHQQLQGVHWTEITDEFFK